MSNSNDEILKQLREQSTLLREQNKRLRDQNILMEEVREQNKAVLAYVGELKRDVQVVRDIVRHTSPQLRDYDRRISDHDREISQIVTRLDLTPGHGA